jgi:hypothetical protein
VLEETRSTASVCGGAATACGIHAEEIGGGGRASDPWRE